ncbi:MAG: hypothetical protein M8353_05865 [ANME-2 cluster archaeon]|nr:hypothetical protein [ANME-2 cluster archaeon]
MIEEIGFYHKSVSYRIWVDEAGIGHILILKRINFKTLVALFEQMHAEIKKINPDRIHIIFYVPKSIYDEMSANAKEFLEFCQSCIGITFELVIRGNVGHNA